MQKLDRNDANQTGNDLEFRNSKYFFQPVHSLSYWCFKFSQARHNLLVIHVVDNLVESFLKN